MEQKLPESFKELMFRPSIKKASVRYLFEEAYPECMGIYDSTGFYSPDFDDASWVDAALIAAEESRLGEDVLSYLEDEANFQPPIIEETEENPVETGNTESEESGSDAEMPKVPEVESVEKRLLDSYNRLKVMEYGSELFFPMQKEGGDAVLVHYSNKSAVRLFYDDIFRLTKKELWNMESVQAAKIKLVEKYTYKDDSKKPVEKIIESDSAVFVSKLNENGLVIRTEKYAVDSKDKPLSVTTWTYDEKDRITSESIQEKGRVQKQVYIYTKIDKLEDNPDNLPPDYEYYENGVLRTKTEYSTKGNYSTTIVFDKINSVRTDYEDYIKVRDVYFMNGVQRRIKSYE